MNMATKKKFRYIARSGVHFTKSWFFQQTSVRFKARVDPPICKPANDNPCLVSHSESGRVSMMMLVNYVENVLQKLAEYWSEQALPKIQDGQEPLSITSWGASEAHTNSRLPSPRSGCNDAFLQNASWPRPHYIHRSYVFSWDEFVHGPTGLSHNCVTSMNPSIDFGIRLACAHISLHVRVGSKIQ